MDLFFNRKEIGNAWHINIKKEYQKLPKSIKRICILSILYVLGWAICVPFIPLFFESVLKELKYVGLVTALVPIVGILISLPLGIIADNISKRLMIKITLLFYLPFGFIFLLIKNILDAIIIQLYHGAIATSLWIGLESYQRGHAPKGKEIHVASLFSMAINLALVIGPIVGGILFIYLKFNIFYLISFFSLIALLYSWRIPDHSKKRKVKDAIYRLFKKKRVLKKEFKRWWKKKEIKKIQTYAFGLKFCLAFFQMLLPIFLKNYGASYLQIGIIYSFFYFPLLFSPYFALVARKKSMFRMFLILGSIIFSTLYFLNSTNLILISTILLAICFAGVTPFIDGRMTCFMKKYNVGEMTGITLIIINMAIALGPLIGGFLADWISINFVFLIGSLILFILFLMSLFKFYSKTLFDEDKLVPQVRDEFAKKIIN